MMASKMAKGRCVYVYDAAGTDLYEESGRLRFRNVDGNQWIGCGEVQDKSRSAVKSK